MSSDNSSAAGMTAGRAWLCWVSVCSVSPGRKEQLPSRNTVRLEPRCATRREATGTPALNVATTWPALTGGPLFVAATRQLTMRLAPSMVTVFAGSGLVAGPVFTEPSVAENWLP